jgi:hypothetical protein
LFGNSSSVTLIASYPPTRSIPTKLIGTRAYAPNREKFEESGRWYNSPVPMLAQASSGKERAVTDRRTGSGGTEDNVRDELDEAAGRGKRERDARKEAVEEEGQAGSGGVKDNVRDEWDESQERR